MVKKPMDFLEYSKVLKCFKDLLYIVTYVN